LGALLGGDRPRAYLVLVRVVFVALSLATTWGIYHLARTLRAAPGYAVVCAAAVGWLAARQQWRPTALLVAVLAAGALADGALDRVTWGGWFQSAREYWNGNIVRGYASMMGRQ